jgi:hypothetical protein
MAGNMVWNIIWNFIAKPNKPRKRDGPDRLHKEVGVFMYSFVTFSAPWRFISEERQTDGGGSVMDIYNEPAQWFWELRFGEQTEAKDRKGRLVVKGAYRQGGSDYAWDIYYNVPKKLGGPYRLRDFEIVHVKTYAEKARADHSNEELTMKRIGQGMRPAVCNLRRG